ncbi:hypothetical protein [Caballeronia sp. INDeC2]|uniref:hypothetical protein n=1 Tax=Caballeronia sp. INDeC2 TaxID=2921747 RepID=UPI002028115E|nr:hypothetical protein [Caballeronia sp. INDeC2]
METRDHLVRLNIGAIPEELNISDWVLLTGDLLYMLLRSDGKVSYVYVPLELETVMSISKSSECNKYGVYRDIRGEPTQLAMYLALVFLDRNVPASAIRRELGMAEARMDWLLGVWHCVSGIIDRNNRLEMIRLLASMDMDDGSCDGCRSPAR